MQNNKNFNFQNISVYPKATKTPTNKRIYSELTALPCVVAQVASLRQIELTKCVEKREV